MLFDKHLFSRDNVNYTKHKDKVSFFHNFAVIKKNRLIKYYNYENT